MVRIISGDIDSGKSTRFINLYKEENSGAGLYSKKLYDKKGNIAGYHLVLLPVEKELPFICLKESVSKEDTSNYHIQGRFAFLKETFRIAERYIMDYPTGCPVWIDEIGGLELKGLGHDALMKTLLKSGRDITFTARSKLLERVLRRYGLNSFKKDI